MVRITSQMSLGKDELYTEWFRCPECRDSYIAVEFRYCPICGNEINWVGDWVRGFKENRDFDVGGLQNVGEVPGFK